MPFIRAPLGYDKLCFIINGLNWKRGQFFEHGDEIAVVPVEIPDGAEVLER